MEIKDIEKEKKLLEKELQVTQANYKTSRKILMKNEAFSKLNFCKCYGQHENSVPGLPQWCTRW